MRGCATSVVRHKWDIYLTSSSTAEAAKSTVVPLVATPPLSDSETQVAGFRSATSSTVALFSTGSDSPGQIEGAPTTQKDNPAPTPSSTSPPLNENQGGADKQGGDLVAKIVGPVVGGVVGGLGIIVAVLTWWFNAERVKRFLRRFLRKLFCGLCCRESDKASEEGGALHGRGLAGEGPLGDAGKVLPAGQSHWNSSECLCNSVS